MTPLQAKIAAIMGDRAMRRCEIIALTGLEPSYASKLLPQICDAEQIGTSRWVLWRIKPGLTDREPTLLERLQAALADVRDTGARTNDLVYTTGLALSSVKRWLCEGRDLGLFAWHHDPGAYCGLRRRWYLTEHKPADPPPPPPKKQPAPKKPKPVARPSIERVSLPSVRRPAQSVGKCEPIRMDERYAAIEPIPRVVDPSDCRPWARYAG